MAIIGVRKGESLSGAWNFIRQRETLAGNPGRVRSGDSPQSLQRMVAKRVWAEIFAFSQVAIARGPQIEIPEMIDDPRLPFRIMKNEATLGQIKQLICAGYEITGRGAEMVKSWCLSTRTEFSGDSLKFLNLYDGRALAQKLNEQGRKFRNPTDAELKEAIKLVRNKLSGDSYTWTETEDKTGGGFYVRCRRAYTTHVISNPARRLRNRGVRLIEDR